MQGFVTTVFLFCAISLIKVAKMLRRLGMVKLMSSTSLLMGLFVAGTATVQAHHSFANFDQDKCGVLTGTVVKYTQSYPHVWLWIEVASAGGQSETWGFEGADPSSMKLRGWSAATLKKGQKIDITFNPLRDGRTGGSMKQVRLSNGEVLSGPQGNFPGESKYCDFAKAQPLRSAVKSQ